MKQLLYLSFILVLLAACSKDDKDVAGSELSNRLNFIINDNIFNFSLFNTGLGRTSYRAKLAEEGPYTVFLPDNNSFIKAGYTTEQSVLQESGAVLNNLIPYHIAYGVWELNKLPFKFNQEIESVTGGKMYVTRWVKNTDTIITINGTRVLSYNLPASNGLIQVMDAVLQPLVHVTLIDAIASEKQLTFLNVAIKRAGMNSLFTGNTPYTFFAPDNAAFIAAGFPDIESVNAAAPETLKKLLEYNFFSGRKFVYDYILTTDATNKTEQAMQSRNNISISLLKSGTNYTGISLRGIGNSSDITISRANVLAGNGVLHITSGLLKENQ